MKGFAIEFTRDMVAKCKATILSCMAFIAKLLRLMFSNFSVYADHRPAVVTNTGSLKL